MFVSRLALAAALGVAAGAAPRAVALPTGYSGAMIRVAQESSPGARDFDQNVLGYLIPFTTQLTCDSFYGYSPNSYRGCYISLNLASNRSHLFMAEAADGMTLMIVHDQVDNGDGGNAEMAFALVNDPDGAVIAVQDDPAGASSDVYYTAPGGTFFTSMHDWSACCTDGLALGGLDGFWSMELAFANVDFDDATPTILGLDDWLAVSADGTEIPLVLEENQVVQLMLVPPCVADLDGDREVGVVDLIQLLGNWGVCP